MKRSIAVAVLIATIVAVISVLSEAISCPTGYEQACQRFVGCKCIPVTCYFDYQNYPYGASVTTYSQYIVYAPDTCSEYAMQHVCGNVNGSAGYWSPPVSGLGSGSIFCNVINPVPGDDD